MSKQRISDERIAEFVQQAKELGISYKEAADRFKIPVWKIYHYNMSLKKNDQPSPDHNTEPSPDQSQSGAEDTVQGNDHSTESPPSSTSLPAPQDSEKNGMPAQVKELIIQYRKQNPDYGFKRIEQYLRNAHFLVIPRKQIRAVLKEAGLLEQNDSSFDQDVSRNEPKGNRRFEAEAPGQLYQMDITYVYIEKIKVLYLINLIDDHSRFCVSASLQFDQSADTLIEVLHKAIEQYGRPEKLLTDQGSAFYSWSATRTKFQNYLDDMQIEHILTDPHHPTTTGKVERFHQTIKNELIRKVKFKHYVDALEKIDSFVYRYNYERPHQSLEGACPADRFMGVSVSKALARRELLSKDLHAGKGYLVHKFGSHETCLIYDGDQEPKVIINGVSSGAKNEHNS